MNDYQRRCVTCGRPIRNPEPGVDYCGEDCREREIDGE